MDTFFNVITFISNTFTILASGIALYLFFTKKGSIKSVFKVLLNYSFQVTLSELKAKLDRLNDLSSNDSTQTEEIINTLNEIVGQIRGNSKLKNHCAEILEKIASLAENPKKLSEPKKRSLVSELRENLKHINIENYDELMGE